DPIEVRKPADYEELLLRASVIADPLKRKAALLSRVQQAAQSLGASLLEDNALVDQVNYLIELPNPVLGSFDRRHLDLPREVLVQEMRGHQRYFSVVDASGNLLPNFVAVSNIPVTDEKLSVRGYERVLRARLADGRFFFDQDRKVSLADRVEKLGRVVWQAKLGTYAEKVVRLGGLATFLAERTNRQAQLDVIRRAATLSKADLVTGMVQEFPELQGVMGREYAKSDGEPAEVCRAIFEHYLPRTASDVMPTEDPGALLGIADRLDTLCGIFAIGKAPTGAADPFGLRRACLAVIHIVLARRFRFSLPAAVERALSQLEPKLGKDPKVSSLGAVKEQVLDFFRGRLKSLWGEQYRADLVEAVLAAGFDDLVGVQLRLEAVSGIAGGAGFETLTTALKRAGNIVDKQGKDVGSGQVSAERLVEQAERNLYRACIAASETVKERTAKDDFGGALEILSALGPSVDAFFNEVMVMAEDRELRKNRIHLLQMVRTLFSQVADFSRVHSEAASVSVHAH
ncbi:MAG TPA: glycine--tRNA ligase subunit beta, partial [Myxococcales bacterium]